MRRIVWITLFLFFAGQTQANTHPIYVVLNMNSCSNCIQVSKVLRSEERVFRNMRFLFSEKEITREQAGHFLHDLYGTIPPMEFNTTYYDLVASKIELFVTPYLVVIDEAGGKLLFLNDVLTVLPDQVDSLLEVAGFGSESTEKVFRHPVFQTLYGYKEIEQLDQYVMVVPNQHREKAYVYNAHTDALDSLVMSDSLVNVLLRKKGVMHIDAGRVRRYYHDNDLPFRLAEFSYELGSDDRYFYADLDILVVDIDSIRDEISPVWYPFHVQYDPVTHRMTFADFKWWRDPEGSETESRQWQELYGHRAIGDSVLVFGGERKTDDVKNKTILSLLFRKNAQDVFTCSEVHQVYQLNNLFDFHGEDLNKPHYAFPYRIRDEYLYFNNAPLVYHTRTGKYMDVRLVSSRIDWIYDLYVVRDRIKLLVREGNEEQHIFLYTLDRESRKVINRRVIPGGFKNCMPRMNSQYICYLDLGGNLHLFSAK